VLAAAGEPETLARQRMTPDNDKVDRAVLALLYLGLHDVDRAWKGFDWDAMNRLHEKGFISDPRGKAKSVAFTEEGLIEARRLLQQLFSIDGSL
jgi:uncharacterized protein DUF6429